MFYNKSRGHKNSINVTNVQVITNDLITCDHETPQGSRHKPLSKTVRLSIYQENNLRKFFQSAVAGASCLHLKKVIFVRLKIFCKKDLCDNFR